MPSGTGGPGLGLHRVSGSGGRVAVGTGGETITQMGGHCEGDFHTGLPGCWAEGRRRAPGCTRPGWLLRAGGSGLGPQDLDSLSREVGGCCGSTGWPAAPLSQTAPQGVGGDLRNAH